MSAKKPVTARGIYEATEKEYDTVDYRRKMCDQWISFQKDQPASVHEPSDLESNAHRTPANRQQKRSKKSHTDDKMSAKRSKHDGEQPKSGGLYDAQKLGDDDHFDEPFFDFEMPNNQMVNNNLASKTGHTKQPGMKQKSSAAEVHTSSKPAIRPQSHSKDVHHSTKRSNFPGHQNDALIFNDVHDVQFNFGSHPNDLFLDEPHSTGRLDNSMKKKKKEETNHHAVDRDAGLDDFVENPLIPSKMIERKRHSDSHHIKFTNDFHDERNLFDNQRSPQHVIYKCIKESRCAVIDTTPMRKKAKQSDDDLFKENIVKVPNDDLLFKKPDSRCLKKWDWKKSEHGDRHKKKHSNYDLVISNEMQEFKSSAINANDGFRQLKAIPKHSVTQQPTIFNIKCTNLVIKTD